MESKGREGKSPRIDLGYKRNCTHEYENNTHQKEEEEQCNQKNHNSKLKVKDERKRKGK